MVNSTVSAVGATPDLRDSTIRKLNLRIVLFCFICFIVNYLDRVNIGYAALHMNNDIGLTPYMFGVGAGIFFIGYMLFEVPSNMMLHKLGSRVWIARIMVTWGSCPAPWLSCRGRFRSTSCASCWALRRPVSRRAFCFISPIGSRPGTRPRNGAVHDGNRTFHRRRRAILRLADGCRRGLFGLHGWQAMFILEGLPAVILGVVTFFYLVDSPEKDKHWLNPDERAWLMAELARENQGKQPDTRHSLKEVFSDYRVWLLTLVYMFNGIAVYGVIMWLPQIVKSLGDYSAQTGLISAIPFVFAAIGLVVISRSSDRTGERKIHTAIAGLFGGVFLAASALSPSPVLSLVLLSVCAFFLWSYLGVFWTLPTQFLSGAAAAGGLAAINGFAQLGGFTGPYLVGWVKSTTDSFSLSLLALSIFPIIGFFLCMSLKAKRD